MEADIQILKGIIFHAVPTVFHAKIAHLFLCPAARIIAINYLRNMTHGIKLLLIRQFHNGAKDHFVF